MSCSPSVLAARRWFEVAKSRDLEEGEALVDIGTARTVVHTTILAGEKNLLCVDAGGEDVTTYFGYS